MLEPWAMVTLFAAWGAILIIVGVIELAELAAELKAGSVSRYRDKG